MHHAPVYVYSYVCVNTYICVYTCSILNIKVGSLADLGAHPVNQLSPGMPGFYLRNSGITCGPPHPLRLIFYFVFKDPLKSIFRVREN